MAEKELTEDQFFFLKGMCNSGVFLIFAPATQDNDPQELKDKHAKVFEQIEDLTSKGFLTNITDKFEEMLAEGKKVGMRPFTAYVISELAIKMFAPPEGSVN